MSTTRTAIVGAFVVGGLLLFAGGLFMIGDRRLLFTDDFEIWTTFTKVSGLAVGTKVRVAGMDAGEVLELSIPPVPSEPFRIRMRLRDDLHHLVRTDSVAGVQTDGIVGSAFIQVSPGSDAAPVVDAGGTIRGNDPIEFADLIEEGRDTFRVVSREVIALTDDAQATVAALTEATQSVNAILVDAHAQMNTLATTGSHAVEEIRQTMVETRGIVEDVRGGRGTFGQLLTDDTLYRRMTNFAGEAEKAMVNVQAVSERARATVEGLTARDGPTQQIVTGLRDTVVEAREVMADLSEGTEALKRNFLFRGFFRDRGFFDLDTLSQDAYVGGALEDNNRTALRIWIDAGGLFEPAPDGTEQLSAEGRRRIDSAMAQLVRYPRDSPLVVEGYAEAGMARNAYLASAERGAIVRDYILNRFRRRATLTGVMPMGSQAPNSPRDDERWSGVALALFVRHQALTQ